jgi:RND family efflux transporter MFP subunit
MPLIAILIAGLGGGGWMVMHAQDSKAVEKKDAKQEKKQEIYELTHADFATVEARELRLNLPVSGALTPLNQATVKSKVAAEVKETLVTEGMPVTKGQAVVRLDTADLASRVATQQAALEEAKAKLSLAQKTQDSNLALLKQKYISQNAFDTSSSQVELAQAAVKSAASQLEIARRALDDATVRAPFDGIISKRLVQAGEKVAPDTPLFAMVNLKQLIFEAQVPASEIPRVKAGQGVVFNVDGFNGRAFNGKVARINPAAEAGSRSMTVYIEVANADGALKGGMFAKGGITLEKSQVAPIVPVAALRKESGGSTVYKIENDKVVVQQVKVGLRNEDEGMAEVIDGLAPGSRVLTVNLANVKPGSSVKLPEASQTKQASADANRKG